MTEVTKLPEDEALSIDQFSARYGICRVSVYRELKQGRLSARKLGRRTLIPSVEAQRWFQSLPAYA
jgi:hypothetical protein